MTNNLAGIYALDKIGLTLPDVFFIVIVAFCFLFFIIIYIRSYLHSPVKQELTGARPRDGAGGRL